MEFRFGGIGLCLVSATLAGVIWSRSKLRGLEELMTLVAEVDDVLSQFHLRGFIVHISVAVCDTERITESAYSLDRSFLIRANKLVCILEFHESNSGEKVL